MKRKTLMILMLSLIVFSFLYGEGGEEIASIREIVEVKKSIVIPKDPVVSALLAVQYPGLGQVYCGKYWRAAGIFVGEIALIGAGITLSGQETEKFSYAVVDSATGDTVYLEDKRTIETDKTDQQKMVGYSLLIAAAGVHIWQIFDAYHQANAHNKDMVRRAKTRETGFNLELKEDGVGLAFYRNF